jgi:hypothetical protein
MSYSQHKHIYKTINGVYNEMTNGHKERREPQKYEQKNLTA